MPNFKHGYSVNKDLTYRTWQSMRRRCNSPKSKDYARYGGKGVTVDPRWDDYYTFLTDMGEKPDGYTIERKDSKGPYCKENCKWATTREQNNNKSDTHRVFYHGEYMTLSQLSNETGVRHNLLRKRIIDQGWDVERAIVEPLPPVISQEQIQKVRQLLAQGMMQKDISPLCGIDKSSVSRISLGKRI